MSRNKRLMLVIGAVVLALVVGATVLWAATTYWTGEGGGEITYGDKTYYPWATWEGERDDEAPSFSGTWTARGGGTGTFTSTEKDGNTYSGTWRFVNPIPEQASDPAGGFTMTFDDESGTCEGDWDSYDVPATDTWLEGERQ